MPLKLRPALLRVALFLVLMALGSWPWSAIETGFSRALSAVGNACFSALAVAPGAEVELLPILTPRERQSSENVDPDTELVLRLTALPGEARLGISLQRDAYLPLVIFVAAILALPLGRQRKLVSLGIGVPLVLAVAVASVGNLALFVLTRAPGSGAPEWQAKLAEFGFDCWLTPPGNRVIAPLLLALGFALGATGPAWFGAPRARAVPTD